VWPDVVGALQSLLVVTEAEGTSLEVYLLHVMNVNEQFPCQVYLVKVDMSVVQFVWVAFFDKGEISQIHP